MIVWGDAWGSAGRGHGQDDCVGGCLGHCRVRSWTGWLYGEHYTLGSVGGIGEEQRVGGAGER